MKKKQEEITAKDLRRLFRMSIDMKCVAGFDGYLKKLNPAWENTFGYTIEELKAKPFIKFVHPEDRDATINEMKKLSTGAKAISFENRYQCKDGSYRWIQWNSVPIVDEKAIYAVARDITQRKEMEKKLKDYDENLEEMVKEKTQVLEARTLELEERDAAISKLSTPLVEVWEGIVMLPVIGTLDSARARQLTEAVLSHIARSRTGVIVMDISGIAAIDTKAASHILRTVQAVRLMGSEIIITGIRPDVATTLVTLGVDLSGIVTRSTLREGLEYAYARLGIKITKTS